MSLRCRFQERAIYHSTAGNLCRNKATLLFLIFFRFFFSGLFLVFALLLSSCAGSSSTQGDICEIEENATLSLFLFYFFQIFQKKKKTKKQPRAFFFFLSSFFFFTECLSAKILDCDLLFFCMRVPFFFFFAFEFTSFFFFPFFPFFCLFRQFFWCVRVLYAVVTSSLFFSPSPFVITIMRLSCRKVKGKDGRRSGREHYAQHHSFYAMEFCGSVTGADFFPRIFQSVFNTRQEGGSHFILFYCSFSLY